MTVCDNHIQLLKETILAACLNRWVKMGCVVRPELNGCLRRVQQITIISASQNGPLDVQLYLIQF